VNYDELTDEEKEIFDAGQEHGYELGYDIGYEESESENSSEADYNYELGYSNGYQSGIEAEQVRIQYVLNMMFESAINMGQGNKAIQYKHAMDLLKPIELNNTVDDDI